MGGFIKAEDFMIDKLDGKADEILVTYIQMLGKTERKYIVLNDDETLSTNLQELMQIMHPFDPYTLAKLHTQQALVQCKAVKNIRQALIQLIRFTAIKKAVPQYQQALVDAFNQFAMRF